MLPKNLIEWKITQAELPDYDGVYYALDDDKNGTVAALYTREKGFINPPIAWGQAVSPTWSMFEVLKSSPTAGVPGVDPGKSLTSNISQVVILGAYAKKGGRKSAVAKFISTVSGEIIVDWLRPDALKDDCALEEARQVYMSLMNGTDPESRKFVTQYTQAAAPQNNTQMSFNPYAQPVQPAVQSQTAAQPQAAQVQPVVQAQATQAKTVAQAQSVPTQVSQPAANETHGMGSAVNPGGTAFLDITDDDLPF